MKKYRYEAEIIEGRGGGAFVEFPHDVRSEFGTGGQVKVKVTFDGESYRGSLAPMGGGRHIIGIRKDIRASIRKSIGDTVSVTVARDTEERIVEIPEELARFFEKNREARKRFESLSYTHRREYAEWIASARKEETRIRRATKALEQILGKK